MKYANCEWCNRIVIRWELNSVEAKHDRSCNSCYGSQEEICDLCLNNEYHATTQYKLKIIGVEL